MIALDVDKYVPVRGAFPDAAFEPFGVPDLAAHGVLGVAGEFDEFMDGDES